MNYKIFKAHQNENESDEYGLDELIKQNQRIRKAKYIQLQEVTVYSHVPKEFYTSVTETFKFSLHKL
jgi:hypothetical protein